MEKTERKEANEKNGNGKKNPIERARCYAENSFAQVERMRGLEIMELQVRKLAENNLPYTPENIQRIADTDYHSKVKDISDGYDNLAALYRKNIEEIGVLEGKIKAYNLFIQDQKTKFNEKTEKLSALAEGLKLYVSGREKEFNSRAEELDKKKALIRERFAKIAGLRQRIIEGAKKQLGEYVNTLFDAAANSAVETAAQDIRERLEVGRRGLADQIDRYVEPSSSAEGAESETPETAVEEVKPEDKTRATTLLLELDSLISFAQMDGGDPLGFEPISDEFIPAKKA